MKHRAHAALAAASLAASLVTTSLSPTAFPAPAAGALARRNGPESGTRVPRVPRVTEIRIDKSEHSLELVAGDATVRRYRVAIGPGGLGPKQYEGDKRTPVGTYRVSGRIDGLFHRFLVVSYPNDDDRRRFAELKRGGEVPAGRGVGHSIGIHGVGGGEYAGMHKQSDWTLGCVALDDDEIDEVARLAPDGTKIVITE